MIGLKRRFLQITTPTAFITSIIMMIPLVGSGQKKDNGSFAGSIESQTAFISKDKKLNWTGPERFATNNHLKISYSFKGLEAAFQYENYLPPLPGYAESLKGHRLAQRYLSYRSDRFQATAGHFFEQFGNGLALRTWEDRSLGINTALDGLNLRWYPFEFLSVKSFASKQLGALRDGKSLLAGANLTFDIMQILKSGNPVSLVAGFSLVHKKEKNIQPGFLATTDAISADIIFNAGNFTLLAEAVSKSYDPSFQNGITNKKGNGLLINPTFSIKGFGANAILRWLKRMDFRSEPSNEPFFMLNYLPANTKQNKYTLANLHPYSAQSLDEYSHQFDLFFTLPANTRAGGKYGTKISANYSGQYLPKQFGTESNTSSRILAYRDINIEIERKITREIKTIFTYIGLNMENYFLLQDHEPQKSRILIADILFIFGKNRSINANIQHLWAEKNDKNWAGIDINYSFHSNWSLFFNDITGYASEKIHYPTAGVQFRKNSFLISTQYGRNRAGYKCSGGICRWTPAYSGVGIMVSADF